MAEKVYLKSSAKARDTRFGQVINIGVKAEDLIAFANQHKNARGYVNLTVSQRKEPGQYGDTHSVTLDTYEPPARGTSADEGPDF
jgi:hypothetical protein